MEQTKLVSSETRLVNWQVAKNEVKILLVHDSRLYAEGLQMLLDWADPQWEMHFKIINNIGQAELLKLAGQDLIEGQYGADSFEMILLTNIKANLGATLQTAECLNQLWQGKAVVWLDVPEDKQSILSCIKSGARGFVMENESPAFLPLVLQKVAKGEWVCPDKALPYLFTHIATTVPVSSGWDGLLPCLDNQKLKHNLSKREMEVLAALVEDYSNREIANLLSIEVRTVKNHVHNILHKLMVNNRREAIIIALQYNLIQPRFLKAIK